MVSGDVDFKGKSLLTVMGLSSEEIAFLIDLAQDFKRMKKRRIPHRLCEGKNIALIFEKASTRTRCAFEVASYDLGMNVTCISGKESQLGNKESVEDTARVLGRMYDAIEYRGFDQSAVEKLAEYSGVPVFNGLTDASHPTQVLADLLTMKERFGSLHGVSLSFFGDARFNMASSLMVGCAKTGVNFIVCANPKYFPDLKLVERCRDIARLNGCSITLTDDPENAAEKSDVIYTDVWVSMGEDENVWAQRITDLQPYRVTADVMSKAHEGAVFMHCLPSFHDLNTSIGAAIYEKFSISEMEVSDEVFRSPASIVFDQAENRMHTIKAVLAATLA